MTVEAFCLKCLASDATVTLDLTDGDTLYCRSCDEEFTVADVEAAVSSWAKLLPWLRQHPARTPVCEAVKVAG
jgi:hypothetical protein